MLIQFYTVTPSSSSVQLPHISFSLSVTLKPLRQLRVSTGQCHFPHFTLHLDQQTDCTSYKQDTLYYCLLFPVICRNGIPTSRAHLLQNIITFTLNGIINISNHRSLPLRLKKCCVFIQPLKLSSFTGTCP